MKAAGRTACLDATPDGQRLYSQFGFAPVYGVTRWQRAARSPAAAAPRSTRLPDAQPLAALDAQALGAPRHALLADFLARPDTVCVRSAEGFAIVRDNAKISGNSIIKDHCIVGGTTSVSGNATIEKLARVFGGNISENAVITGSAMIFNSSLKDYSVIGDLAEVSGLNLSGTVVVGGDATGLSACSAGTYLQTERTGCDKKDFPKTNIDINVDPSDYIFPFGSIPTAPFVWGYK